MAGRLAQLRWPEHLEQPAFYARQKADQCRIRAGRGGLDISFQRLGRIGPPRKVLPQKGRYVGPVLCVHIGAIGIRALRPFDQLGKLFLMRRRRLICARARLRALREARARSVAGLTNTTSGRRQ